MYTLIKVKQNKGKKREATPDKSVELQNVTNDNSSNGISFFLAGSDSRISAEKWTVFTICCIIFIPLQVKL